MKSLKFVFALMFYVLTTTNAHALDDSLKEKLFMALANQKDSLQELVFQGVSLDSKSGKCQLRIKNYLIYDQDLGFMTNDRILVEEKGGNQYLVKLNIDAGLGLGCNVESFLADKKIESSHCLVINFKQGTGLPQSYETYLESSSKSGQLQDNSTTCFDLKLLN